MRKRMTGFTLIEIAIVLVIIGLAVSGLFSSVGMLLATAKLRETRQVMADTRESLMAFAVINRRLPCPADPTLDNTAAGVGQEDLNAVTGLCRRLNGVVPWNTLGVKELDAWGGRYSYSVMDDYTADNYLAADPSSTNRFSRRLPAGATADFCNAGRPPTTTFRLCSTSSINVLASVAGAGPLVAAVIVSHGQNRRGAFTPYGGARIPGALGDELENANGNTAIGGALDVLFINKPFVHDPDPLAAAYFDDLVEIVPVPALIGKMVGVGLLP